jgi:hypothetical protein
VLRPNLSHHAGETHHLDTFRAGTLEGERSRVGRRAARVDVVDEADTPRSRARRAEGLADVAASFDEGQPTLPARGAAAAEKRFGRQLPAAPELDCELLGGMMTATQAAVAVGRHERDRHDVGSGDGVGDETCGLPGQSAQPALLPAADEAADGVVVLDGGSGGRERELPPGAVAAARDRPDGGRATASAERRDDRRQPVAARIAELRARTTTGEATLREEKVEQNPTLAR